MATVKAFTEAEAYDGPAIIVAYAHCIAWGIDNMANGLDALHLVLRAWDIGPGDEVIVPSQTFIATWLAVSWCGATPVPVEIDENCLLDPERIEAAITVRTRAIVPVHLFGQPADMGAVLTVARNRGLRVLEDAAQAHGARYHGQPCGSLAECERRQDQKRRQYKSDKGLFHFSSGVKKAM